MNLPQLTLAARKATGEYIGVVAKNGQLAVARYTKVKCKREPQRELLTEWSTMAHVCAVLAGMIEDCEKASA